MNEEKHFHVGLNLDDDPKTLSDGEYRFALNGRSGTSSEGNVLDIEDILSSAQTAVTQFAASALIIGAAKDYANNALIFFVYRDGSGSDDPIIVRWFVDTDTYEFITPEIWDNSILTWTPTTRIWNAKIVNTGLTQLLFWVETNSNGSGSSPKCIDLNISDNRPGSYTLTIDDISVAKKPPIGKPVFFYRTDSTVQGNYIYQKSFQFIYNYIYENGQESTWSPISNLTRYTGVAADEYLSKKLEVFFNSGPKGVVKVQVARRIGNGVSETGEDNPNWYIFSVWTKGANADDADYSVYFFNNEALTAVPTIDSDKLFDLVPLTAGSQEVVDSNQVVYGDITEGYDNVTLNIDLAIQYLNSGIRNYNPVAGGPFITFGITNPPPASLTILPEVGDTWVVRLLNTSTAVFTNYSGTVVTNDLTSWPANFATTIAAVLTAAGISTTYNPATATVSANLEVTTANRDVERFYTFNYNTKTGFKSGFLHNVGIVYYDAYGRQGGVNKIGSIIPQYLPLRGYMDGKLEAGALDKNIFQIGSVPQIKVTIKNLPPTWAVKYDIVHNSNVNRYLQCTINDITYSKNRALFKIQTITSWYIANLLNEGIVVNFSKGDRIRFYFMSNDNAGSPNAWPFAADNYFGTLGLSEYITDVVSGTAILDVAIESYDSSTGTFTTEPLPPAYIGALGLTGVEIYSIANNEIYLETGYRNNIINPGAANRFHEAAVQNQDPNNPVTTPAIVLLEKGDTYFRFRAMHDAVQPTIADAPTQLYFVESPGYSDVFESNYYDKGRPQIETPNQKQQRTPFMGRWGGKLIPNSSINNMSSFDEGNYFTVSADYGAITALRQIGFTLKIIQEANYNTTYLNRRNITSPDGSTQLVVTDELISEINPSEYLFGTKHKGSVVVNEHNVYWVDTLRGMVIREAGNEPFPISNYKTVGHWRDKSKLINEEGYQIVGEFDKKLGQLFLSITGTDYSETISFHEKDNRWKSFHDHFVTVSAVDYPITVYGAIGQVIVGCIRNLTHQLNVGSGYLNLFGTARTFKVKVVFNDNPKKVKAWLASMLNSNIKPTKVTLIVPPDMQIPNGMKSILLPGNYSVKEGKLYAAIKKDGLTKGAAAEDSALFKAQLVSGRKMRGQTLEVEIEYTGDEYFTIFEAGSEYTLSEKS